MSIFKNTFHPSIKNQLNKRQESIKDRSPQSLSYLNSRNAWIRLSSSVNTLKKGIDSNNVQNLLTASNYDNSLANQYILQGGTLYSGSLRAGLISEYTKGGSYNVSSSLGEPYRLGIRPMPGITNVEIKSKGAYGSLRVATVNFQCWDIKQLEDLELLYMRPGYTVLLEWGWSPYINNKGTYTVNVDYTDIINTDWKKEELFKRQYARSTDGIYYDENNQKKSIVGYEGNTDSMFGYIKNYNWKARMDGGYDCSIDIISIGEVIESLKVNYIPAYIGEAGTNGLLSPNITYGREGVRKNIDTSYMTELSSSYSQNVLAGIFYELHEIVEQVSGDFDKTNSNGTSYLLYDNKYNKWYDTFRKTINIKGGDSEVDSDVSIGKSNEQVYITLETLTHILNDYVLLKDKKSGKPFAEVSVYENSPNGEKLKLDPISGEGYLLSLAHPIQVSTDPTVCLIKSPLWENGFTVTEQIQTNIDPNSGQPVIAVFGKSASGKNYYDEKWWKTLGELINKANNGTEQPLIDFVRKSVGTGLPAVEELKEIQRQFLYEVKKGKNDFEAKPGRKFSTYNNFYDLLDEGLWSDDLLTNQVNEAIGASVKDDPERKYWALLVTAAKSDPIEITKRKIISEQSKLNKQQQQSNQGSTFLYDITRPYFTNNDYSTELGIIGNIYVNINMLYNLCVDKSLESQDKKEKREIVVYDFLKNILSKISTSIGDVNNFDIHVDPNTNIARIIDVNYVDKKTAKQAYDDAYVLQVHNLDSIVRSYSLESKIFPEQSSIVAISAQVGGGALGVDTSTLVDFNRSIRDRIIPIKNANTTPTTEEVSFDVQLPKLKESLLIIYEYFSNLKTGFASGDYDVDKSGKYQSSLRDLINFFKALGKSKIKNKAIIPTVLSLEIDGIGGIIIGNLFRINEDILPRGYKSGTGTRLGYVVTGLGHSLNGNDWVTKIDAQTIILDEPQGEQEIDFTNLSFISGNVKTTIKIGTSNLNYNTNFVAEDNAARKSAEIYIGRKLSNQEWNELMATTFAEASDNQEERAYVMGVILNRARIQNKTVSEIIRAQNQFQSVTGTPNNGRNPDNRYVNGLNKYKKSADYIYDAAINILNKVPKNFTKFTSNNEKAYKTGTNISYLYQLRKTGKVIGQTVFSS